MLSVIYTKNEIGERLREYACASGRHSLPTDIDICVTCWTFEVYLLGEEGSEDDCWGTPFCENVCVSNGRLYSNNFDWCGAPQRQTFCIRKYSTLDTSSTKEDYGKLLPYELYNSTGSTSLS